MKTFKKRILFILLYAFVFTVLAAGFCSATEMLEVKYPTTSTGVVVPTTTKTLLSDYIKYIFSFSLVIGGLIAFSALILGGFKHTTSGGNPAKMADAKDQMFSAIIGLIILLSSFLILNTVNPKLTILRLDVIPPAATAIELYTEVDLGGEPHIYGLDNTINDLSDFKTKSIKISDNINLGDVDVYVYPEVQFQPTGGGKRLATRVVKNVEDTFTYSNLGFIPRSIEIKKKQPGAYLCTEINFEGKCEYVSGSVNRFSSLGLDNKVKSIYFINEVITEGGVIKTIPVRAILHKDENQEGKVAVLLSNSDVLLNPFGIPDLNNPITPPKGFVGYEGSSLTLLKLDPYANPGGEIVLCRNHDCTEYDFGSGLMDAEYVYHGFNDSVRLPRYWSALGKNIAAYDVNLQDGTHFWDGTAAPVDEDDWLPLAHEGGVSAIKITGGYVVMWCKDRMVDTNGVSVDPGDCWVLGEQSDPHDLLGWAQDDEASSIMVFKIYKL